MHYANTYLEKPVVPDVKITGEGTTDVLKCMLNTGSDIYQGACKKRGSTLKEEYKNDQSFALFDETSEYLFLFGFEDDFRIKKRNFRFYSFFERCQQIMFDGNKREYVLLGKRPNACSTLSKLIVIQFE